MSHTNSHKHTHSWRRSVESILKFLVQKFVPVVLVVLKFVPVVLVVLKFVPVVLVVLKFVPVVLVTFCT
jgi:hypothetical protein